MVTIGSFEAQTHFVALLERVAQGETVQITKRGVPVANLVRISATEKRDLVEAVRRIREMSKGVTLGSLKIQQLIDEGRP